MRKPLSPSTDVIAAFREWQCPKRGTANPEVQTNPVWAWLIETGTYPLAAHKAAGNGDRPTPGWSFQRFGLSETPLPDGSTLYFGGEHEDHYDEDFYIYNDVILRRPDGSVEVYGYPVEVFPPTDFHSATLCGDEIVIVGGLRYPGERQKDTTWVFRLRLEDFSIQRLATQGTAPCWLYQHSAELSDDGRTLRLTGGQVTHHPTRCTVENLTTWELDLETMTWRAGETRAVQRWLLMRDDEGINDLYEIKLVAEASRSNRWRKHSEAYRAAFEARGHTVDADLYFNRFSPPLPHEPVAADPDSDNYRTHRIRVGGTIVRYVEDMHEIAVTVEGQLDADTVEALIHHGVETYGALEGVPYKVLRL